MLIGTAIAACIVGVAIGFGIAASMWSVAGAETVNSLVEKNTASLTAQVESLGEDLADTKGQLRESARLHKQADAGLATAREHVAKRDADAVTNAKELDNVTGELRRTQAKLEQLIVDHEAELGKLNAENKRLRGALVASETLLGEQRGLVAKLQESIRINGEAIEDRDDRIEFLEMRLSGVQYACSNDVIGTPRYLFPQGPPISKRRCSFKESGNASRPESEVEVSRVESAWQDTPLPAVSREPITALPKNVYGPEYVFACESGA